MSERSTVVSWTTKLELSICVGASEMPDFSLLDELSLNII